MRGLRIVILTLLFCASLSLTTFAIHSGLEAARIEPRSTRIQTGRGYDARIDGLMRIPAGSRAYYAIYLGDSMVIDFPAEKRLPHVLEREIQLRSPRGRRVRVLNFGQLGTGIFDYYMLADRLALGQPDLVILPFNLANTAPAWRSSFSRPELAGWIAADRIAEALVLPLSWAGVTADRLLFHLSLMRVGALDAWARLAEEQTRVNESRLAIERWFAAPAPGRSSPEDAMRTARDNQTRRIRNIPRSKRYSEAGIRYLMGPALDGLQPGHPTLAVLGATVRRFRERDIDVLVYVNPINVDHIERVGMLDPERLGLTLASIEQVVMENGGQVLDLHGIFRDPMFRDHTGHFRWDPPFDGSRALAAHLAPHVIALATETPRRGSAEPD